MPPGAGLASRLGDRDSIHRLEAHATSSFDPVRIGEERGVMLPREFSAISRQPAELRSVLCQHDKLRFVRRKLKVGLSLTVSDSRARCLADFA